MTTSVGRIALDLGLNYGPFKKDLKNLGPKSSSLVQGAFGKLGALGAAAFSVKALYQFGKASVNLASDLIEVQNVVDVTFKQSAQKVNDFAKSSLESYGLAELSAKKYSSTMGAMLKSSGFATDAAADMSIEIAKLSADMASFYNLDSDVAFNKIRSGISGETEPLKQLGINMNVANLEAFALSQGIKKSYNAMSQSEQVMLRYNYLLKTSADSQGDFARNSGTWANQVKILSERWKEFMSILGTNMMEMLLPVVKFLNKALEIIINIAKEIQKIYTMITGRDLVVEATNNMSESAEDALDAELGLADGIKKSAAEAKKALAPFDQLNILRSNKSAGSGDGIGAGLGIGDGKTTTSLTLGDSKTNIKKDTEEIYAALLDFNNRLGQLDPVFIEAPVFAPLDLPIYDITLEGWGLTPPMVPEPYFPPILNPVYEPEWNLDAPPVREPYFPPILNPVYEPNWNLEPPVIPIPIMPALDYSPLEKSLGEMEKSANRHLGKIQEGYTAHQKELGRITTEGAKGVNTETEKGLTTKTKSISLASNLDEKNLGIHQGNVGKIAVATGGVLVKGFAEGLTTKSKNTVTASTADEKNLNSHGANVGSIATSTALAFALNLNKGYESSYLNTTDFANASISAMNQMGSGMARSSAQSAEAINSNYSNGFAAAWDNFKDFASATGEKVSGWFSANKRVITTTAIVGAGAIAAGGLALAFPAAIPYIGATLKGLSAAGGLAFGGAMARGGIVDTPTLALIGEAGKEAVMPLENNTGWIRDLAMQIAGVLGSGNQQGNSAGQPIYLTIKIGEETLMEYLINAMNREMLIRGEKVIEV